MLLALLQNLNNDMQQIAIFDETRKIKFEDLQDVAKAIQMQVSTDVKPIWGCDYEIVAYSKFDVIPYYAWKATIMDKLDIDVYGYHYLDDTGKPFLVLKYREDWTLTLSHEVVEMAIDPKGDRVMTSENFFTENEENFLPAEVNGVKEVLVEVADPSQAPNFGYYITVGSRKVLVSDFYYPCYFTDRVAIKGKKYSQTGAITKPKQILEGGYVSFKNNVGEWWQAFKVEGKLIFRKVGDKKETLSNQDLMTILTYSLYALGLTALTLILKSIFGKKHNEIPTQNSPKNFHLFKTNRL